MLIKANSMTSYLWKVTNTSTILYYFYGVVFPLIVKQSEEFQQEKYI